MKRFLLLPALMSLLLAACGSTLPPVWSQLVVTPTPTVIPTLDTSSWDIVLTFANDDSGTGDDWEIWGAYREWVYGPPTDHRLSTVPLRGLFRGIKHHSLHVALRNDLLTEIQSFPVDPDSDPHVYYSSDVMNRPVFSPVNSVWSAYRCRARSSQASDMSNLCITNAILGTKEVGTPWTEESFPVWSPNGEWIAFQAGGPYDNIFITNREGTEVSALTFNYDPAEVDFQMFSEIHPAWSQDGEYIAFASDREQENNFDIYVIKRDGTELRRLTQSQEDDSFPVWSPNGQWIAFHRSDGNFDIWIVNSDGSREIHLVENPAKDGYPAWSPDSQWLAFESNRNGNWDIFVVGLLDDRVEKQLTSDSANDRYPYWLPEDRD